MKYLIVGLGNIGSEYHETRHNIGFMVLDALAEKQGLSLESDRLASTLTLRYKGRILYLVEPSTYMNLSGKAVRYHLDKHGVELENILVITDDLSIKFGQVRMRAQGSAGGHNGLKSIEEHLKTQAYPRMRIGIGSEFSRGGQVDYVLGKFSEEEQIVLPKIIEHCVQGILSFATQGVGRTMSQFNAKNLIDPA